ncbi:ion channel [Paludibaculum fermentans]|uniref:Ion transport 2 domain protein n=1 Tax=Paludibaculum fermentans TaxID=1473598 RepID=A0A7S7NSY1_PALFE|nr:ion channel [Paludibaculum fermentans]QOY89225.1 hypothetical protein IRI77_04510 [Paludibaculum fermentans]
MAKIAFDPGITERFSGRLRRIIDEDGSFNVRRVGGHLRDAGYFLYFMNLSWPAFLVQVPLIYLGIELLFAIAYYLVGVENLSGAPHNTPLQSFASAFFFSIQTFTTVGYGHIAPNSLMASSVAAVEAMSGILSLAIATGLIFARFSRPSAHMAFSENAVIAPFQDGQALMFRVANRRPNVLLELEARILLMTVENVDGELKRRYAPLNLERPGVLFLPLVWTVVHPITMDSPLWGRTPEDLQRLQAEFLVMIKAFDDTFSQSVHARRSYLTEEVKWNMRFAQSFRAGSEGEMELDLARLNDQVPA